MKPKALHYPFPWEQRRVCVDDGVWYVPDHYPDYADYSFPGWSDAAFFGNDLPVKVEYCSGNGSWVVERAVEHPESNWLAVEWRFDRVRKIWSKMKNHALSNLRIVSGEAWTATHHYFPTASIDEVFINFPDPWPKKRHAKHRLLAPRFLDELARILPSGHAVTFVTDDVDTSERSLELFGASPAFESAYGPPGFVSELPGYGSSYFDALWRSKGRSIRFHQFLRRGGQNVSEIL